MIALIRYSFAVVLHTQRYVAPLLLFIGLMGVLTVNGSGALPPAYASSAGALFLCSVWLTVALLGLDAPAQRAIVVVGAGQSFKVLLGSVATVLISCLILTTAGLAFPLWVGSYDVGAADLLLGVVAQLACACAGTAIGVFCSRLVFARRGYALVVALALVTVMLFVRGMPPVNRLFHLMATSSDSAELLGPASGMLIVAVAFLLVSTCVTQYLVTRKD